MGKTARVIIFPGVRETEAEKVRALVEEGGEAKRKEAELVPHHDWIISQIDTHGLSAVMSWMTRLYQTELDKREAEKNHD